MLSVAAREADIVGIHGVNGPHGMDMSDTTPQAIEQKVGWVREAAGGRFDALELACTIFSLSLRDSRRQADDSVHSLTGSVEAVVDELQARREQFGLSYYQVRASMMEAFAPVVARLGGK